MDAFYQQIGGDQQLRPAMIKYGGIIPDPGFGARMADDYIVC